MQRDASTPDAAEMAAIVALLFKAGQRSLILRLSGDWTPLDVRMIALETLRPLGLLESAPTKTRFRHNFRLTPLGLAIRQLLQKDQDDV
jgi:hypothetical protein